jgi:hypothetical protein
MMNLLKRFEENAASSSTFDDVDDDSDAEDDEDDDLARRLGELNVGKRDVFVLEILR